MYLNQEKVQSVLTWFDPLKINDYPPLPVYDFRNNGRYVLTDGHSRAYIAYKSGIRNIPVVIDKDDIVTCDSGRKLYNECIYWCKRFSINSIKDLEHRIIPNEKYEFLWIKRCDRLNNLLMAIEDKLIPDTLYEELKRIGFGRDLILYGTNNYFSSFYYEDLSGNLLVYTDGQFANEDYGGNTYAKADKT